jgi:hypothetical protein
MTSLPVPEDTRVQHIQQQHAPRLWSQNLTPQAYTSPLPLAMVRKPRSLVRRLLGRPDWHPIRVSTQWLTNGSIEDMRGVLLLCVLTVKSSYSRNIEIALSRAGDIPDTLQWWFGESGCWRIRTYAIDHDIHVYGVGDSPNTTVEFAKENNLKHYRNVISNQFVFDFENCLSLTERVKRFGAVALAPNIEVDADGGRFVFWKPDHAAYRTISKPKQDT